MEKDSFYTVQFWMIDELGLKGDEKDVYAIIYGFSQSNGGYFHGGRQYLADFLGCSVRTIQYILNKLTKQGLLEKGFVLKNGLKFCTYKTLRPVQNFHPCKNFTDEKTALSEGKNCTYPVQNFHLPSEESAHNNKVIINNNKSICNSDTQTTSFLQEFCRVKNIELSDYSRKLLQDRLSQIKVKEDFLDFAWNKVVTKYPNKNKNEYQKLFVSAVTSWNDLPTEYKSSHKEESTNLSDDEEQQNAWWEKCPTCKTKSAFWSNKRQLYLCTTCRTTKTYEEFNGEQKQ